MKVLVLIISSDTDPVYEGHKKVWRSYMNSNPQIESYFIQYHAGPQAIERDTFWLSGKESFPGILIKTLDSLDYFLKKDSYDFIVRTNLSSLWNFSMLLKHLETLPCEKVYNGIIGNHNGITFVSGAGIIMTPDTARLLLQNRDIAESVKIIDDVDIGYTLDKVGIACSLGKRIDNLVYDENSYHYRVKLKDRTKEHHIMLGLLDTKRLNKQKMKLGTILTACDLNPLYSEFIPNFIKAWTILFPSADVIVVLIADEIPESLKAYEKNLRLFKPIPKIHTAFQAQCIRLLYPRQIERNEGVLITDMDMLPMNRSYYMDSIKDISDDTFVTYRDVCLPTEIAMCYNIACPSVWKGMFSDVSTESLLREWYGRSNYDGLHGGKGWGTDQQILLKMFNKWNGPKVTLNDQITNFRRLDRIHPWIFNDHIQLATSIRDGIYIDYHCLRPYSQFKEINDFVVSCLN